MKAVPVRFPIFAAGTFGKELRYQRIIMNYNMLFTYRNKPGILCCRSEIV